MINSMIGETFGRLTVIGDAYMREKCKRVLCKCRCGAVKEVRLGDLKSGKTKSCGCLHRDRAKWLNKTHGLSRRNGRYTRLYMVWRGMKNRCNNPNTPDYRHYGGRNIAVCKEWQEYEPFHKWATSSGYRDDLTIERIDNNKGYSKFNCTWIPGCEQPRNQRSNKLSMKKAINIRELYKRGALLGVIAEKFGISQRHTLDVITNKTWKNNP